MWQNRNLQRRTCLLMFRQVPHPRKKSDCILKSGDTHSYGETWKQDQKKFKVRRIVEFSSAAARCIPWRVDGHSHGETCRYKWQIRCGPFRIWNWEGVKKMWQGDWLLAKQLRRNTMHPANQTAKLKRQNGHIVYTCLQPQFIVWKQSSRSSGESTDENMTWTPTPKPTYSPTLCPVWEKWRIWNESMVCRRSSSGKYQCEPEHFKDRISSCQCTTTLHGEKKEIQKDLNTIHRQLRNMLVNSLAVIGLSWNLDQKRNGTEPTPTNPTDPGIEWQKKWCWISQIPIIQYFVPSVPSREGSYEAKEGERSQYTSTVVMKT